MDMSTLWKMAKDLGEVGIAADIFKDISESNNRFKMETLKPGDILKVGYGQEGEEENVLLFKIIKNAKDKRCIAELIGAEIEAGEINAMGNYFVAHKIQFPPMIGTEFEITGAGYPNVGMLHLGSIDINGPLLVSIRNKEYGISVFSIGPITSVSHFKK